MLQSKGLSSRATEEDHERTRRLADAEMTIHQLEGLLEQKDKEMLQLREVRVCVCVCVCVSLAKKKQYAIKYYHVCRGESLCISRCECVHIRVYHIQAKPLASSSLKCTLYPSFSTHVSFFSPSAGLMLHSLS